MSERQPFEDVPLKVEHDGAPQTVTLSRPGKLDALNPAMLEALHDAVRDFDYTRFEQRRSRLR